jgi:hypothetical protein
VTSGRNNPGLRRRRSNIRPLSVLSRKAKSAYCASCGLPSRPCSLAFLGSVRTTCYGSFVTEMSACVSGYAWRVEFAMKRLA